MITGNLVRNINKVLSWEVTLENDHREPMDLFEENDSYLLKVKLAKKLTKGHTDCYKAMMNELSKKLELSNHEKMMIKHKAMTFLNSLLEMQKDSNMLKKMKKDMDVELLKNLITHVYCKFSVAYNKRYGPKCLNHFDQKFVQQLSPKDQQKTEGVILETGFFALFIILRLYQSKGKSFDRDNMIYNEINQLKEKVGKRETYKNIKQQVSINQIYAWYSSMDEESDTSLMKKVKKLLYQEASYFFYFYSSMIEITRDKMIEEIYFIRYPYVIDLQQYEKDTFNREVKRTSTKLKVGQLVNKFDDHWTSMRFNYSLRSKNKWISLVFTNDEIYLDFSFILVKISE